MSKISLLPEAETNPSTATRPLMFSVKTREHLYSFYMPFLTYGGLFVPALNFGSQASNMPPPGSKIMMLLSLLDDAAKKTVTGKVCWISPPGSSAMVAGVGVHFDDNDVNRQLRDQIEKQLAGILGKSEIRNQTF